jgi:hypothetical protein
MLLYIVVGSIFSSFVKYLINWCFLMGLWCCGKCG